MKRIISNTLIDFLVNQNIVPKVQHDFLPDRSAITNMMCSTYVLYLDFSKTFDRVAPKYLAVKLDHFVIRGDLLIWTSAFLSNTISSAR